MDADWALAALAHYGLWGIFVVIALEYACLPLPSEVLLPFSGLAAAAAGIPLALAVFVSVAAGLAGSSVCYALGALGGRPLVDRLLRRFPAAQATLLNTSRWHQRAGRLSVMVARVIPVFRTWISFAAGIARQPYGAFALYSSMGMIVWNTVLISGGYFLYRSGAARQATRYIWALPLAGGALMLVFFRIRRIARRRRAGAASSGEGVGK